MISMFKIINTLLMVCFIFLVGYFFGIKEARFYQVISGSMEPTLNVDDRVMTIKKSRIERKNIVLIKDPKISDEILIKRIIGLPGEKVEVKKGKVFINGRVLSEPYIKEPPIYSLKIKVAENQYFLLGDNRNKSEDSSTWGPVDEELIISKVVLKYWPIKEFKLLLHSSVVNIPSTTSLRGDEIATS